MKTLYMIHMVKNKSVRYYRIWVLSKLYQSNLPLAEGLPSSLWWEFLRSCTWSWSDSSWSTRQTGCCIRRDDQAECFALRPHVSPESSPLPFEALLLRSEKNYSPHSFMLIIYFCPHGVSSSSYLELSLRIRPLFTSFEIWPSWIREGALCP